MCVALSVRQRLWAFVGARAQLASHTLLSSDLFAVGGYGSIRGFDIAEEAAEAGYVFSLGGVDANSAHYLNAGALTALQAMQIDKHVTPALLYEKGRLVFSYNWNPSCRVERSVAAQPF